MKGTEIHRVFCPQIITVFVRHGNPRLFVKRHGFAPHRFIHSTSWLRLASQVHGLVCSAETSRVYTFSIALRQIKPLSIAQLAVPFSKPCPSVPKKFLIGFPSGRRTSFPNSRALFPHVSDYSLQRLRFWVPTSQILVIKYYLCTHNNHINNKIKIPIPLWSIQQKKELAQAYCPDIDYTAALKKLNHWIRTNTELSARLAATGYITTQRRFTPQCIC